MVFQQTATDDLPSTLIPTISRAPLPPNALGPATPPLLYSTLVGNGRLLAGLDATGSLAQLFYPHIDAGPHLRVLHWGIQVKQEGDDKALSDAGLREDGSVSWLAGPDWTHDIQHVE